MKLRRVLSCMMALLLVCSLPVSAFADKWHLDEGSITVNATESGQTVSQGETSKNDDAPVITQHDNETPTANTVTIKAEENATAEVTLSGVNIDVSGTGNIRKNAPGEAAVQITGNGDVTLELDGTNTVQSGSGRAGVEKNTIAATSTNPGNGNGNLTITDENGTAGSLESTGGLDGSGIGGGHDRSGSNITITGNAEVTAKGGPSGSGIGGGAYGNGSNIKISGTAEVTAKGGNYGSGIGGGYKGSGSNITISQDAQVKAQGGNGGESKYNSNVVYGAGAAIGNGGKPGYSNSGNLNGAEATPNTDELTPNGKIEYYAPGAEMENDDPSNTVTGTYVPPQPTEPEEEVPQTAALYRVLGQDGKALSYKTARKDGVLTITVDADFAILTGSLSGMKTLKAQGVDAVVFVTNGASSTFAIANLLAQGSSADTYNLTHNGTAVTFTLNNGADINKNLQ